MSNKPEQAIKNLKRVANFNGRREEGEKIDIKVRELCVFVLLHHLSVLVIVYTIILKLRKLSFCILDAARVHDERDVLFAGLLLCPGSVPHTHNEDNNSLPECCLVHVLHCKLRGSF